jgi:hypothetical protein
VIVLKGLINGEVVELTEEQIAEITAMKVEPIITDKQRISALENALADLAVMLVGGISND